MSSSSDGTRSSGPAAAPASSGAESTPKARPLEVEHAGRRRPFMRGIMVHSLMARGVGFEDAYRTANQIRERIGDRELIQRQELAKAVREILGDALGDDDRPGAPGDIIVTGEGKGLPFSKGILSQSLLAAAIEPSDAFEVARDIERELLERAAREIDRRDLRRLAYLTLSRRLGEHTAERYLVWRQYQEPDRPVILLLGGTAGVGKTTLALEVAHRLGIGRVLSTDSIRQIMRMMLSPDLVPAIHGSSYDAERLLPGEVAAEDAVLEGFRAQTGAVAVGVRASMDRAVSENASMVLDGVALVPGMLDLEAYAELAHVIFLVVATLDEESFGSRFSTRAAGAHRRTEHRYLENLDAILRIQDQILELADRHDISIIDNVSFDRSVLLIIRHVAEALRKKDDFRPSDLL